MYWIKDNEVYRGPAMGRTWMESHGWTASETPPPVPEEPPAPRVLSKLKLRDKLEAIGAWAQLREELEAAGECERWLYAHDVAEDDPGFVTIIERLKPALAASGIDLDELLNNCILERY